MVPGWASKVAIVQARAQATVNALIAATIDQLEAVGELGVRLEAVAERAGVSLGAIYHHFGDKDSLIDAARLDQFTRQADADTAALRQALASVSSHDELLRRLPQISAAFQTPDRRPLRARRLANLAATLTRPDYAAQVAQVQHRVTRDLVGVLDDLRVRNVIAASADTLALATFIQAYTLGQVVADVDHDPVPAGRWNAAVLSALRELLPPPEEVGPLDSAPVGATTRGQATARALLDAARRQIETRTDNDFRVDEILAEVGVSPSSLYHYFGSREGLMEAAWVDWARHNAEADVAAVAEVLDAATTPDEATAGLVRVTRAAQDPRRAERRVQRLMVLAAAARRPGVRAEIGRLETLTNQQYRQVLERARGRGLLAEGVDLEVLPVFVRAFSFGRVTNELSAEPVDVDAWNALVEQVMVRLLGVDDTL
jgi:AcrR family transcriptional regulator